MEHPLVVLVSKNPPGDGGSPAADAGAGEGFFELGNGDQWYQETWGFHGYFSARKM